MSKIELEWLSPDQIKPDPRNPRKHSDRQIKQIAASIKAFGFNSPV
jgi:ParB-like chromosome segregation protein Spo0J